jgi:hypothetical protein
MKNITSKVSRDDMDNARIDRNRTANPADVEPGMGDFGWGNDDMGGGGDAPSSGGGWGSNVGGDQTAPSGPFGQSGGAFGGFGQQGAFGGFGLPQPEVKKDSTEDKFWAGFKKIGTGVFSFAGEFVKSFKTFDVVNRMQTGKSILITGSIVSLVGIILLLFGLGAELGLNFLVGGLVSVGIGVPLFMFSYDDFLKNGAPVAKPSSSIAEEAPSAFDESSFGFGSGEEDEEFDMFPEDEDDLDSFPVEDSLDFSAFDTVDETSSEEIEKNMGSVLDTLNANNGMVTRQYLFENIISCLSNYNKNFDVVRTLVDGSDEFDAWDAIIQNSATILKTSKSEDAMPYLIEAKDKLFYTLLEIKRVPWIKNIETFVAEIVEICRFDKETGRTDSTIYGIGNTVGQSIYVKIMKGETAMVTIKDAYKNVADVVKDNANAIPIILGLDAEGSVVWRDFKDINSILVTGMARSGKTWLVQSILTQMMFFLPPSKLHFYIMDTKDAISDFKAMQMPHIRKFVSKNEDILKELRNIVKVEGPRRKKIIGDAGFVNLNDYKRRNPDVDLPLLYVVIDEVVTLSESMDKETKDEFQGLLLELVSQLPALGIRIFMIPHLVKDQVLKKSITDLIPCRVSVRGNAEHIEKSVGVKNFKHKLFHQGDMAVRFNNDEPFFVHSAVLTSSNEGNNDLFDFLLKFWSKLEPESLKGSLYEKLQVSSKNGVNSGSGRVSVTLATESTGKTTGKVQNKATGLSKESVDDLLKGLSDNSDLDLWGK